MATDPFYGSLRAVARAKDHTENLHAEMRRFLGPHPYELVIEPDADGVNEVHKVRLTSGEMPPILADIAFDAVCTLRAALDRAGYEVAVASGNTSPKHTHFPFGSAATKFNTGRSKDIPAEILNVMREFKPYRGGNDGLWSINELRNIGNHRRIATVGMATSHLNIEHMTVSKAKIMFQPRWDREKHEMILAIVEPGGKAEYKLEIRAFVAFDDVEPIRGQPAVAFLRGAASVVERVVMAVEAEARRIGLIT